jgi:hypothetical protein
LLSHRLSVLSDIIHTGKVCIAGAVDTGEEFLNGVIDTDKELENCKSVTHRQSWAAEAMKQ